MRKWTLGFILLLVICEYFSGMGMAQSQSVRGYTRQSGTVVQPYSRNVPIYPQQSFGVIPYAAFPQRQYNLDFSGPPSEQRLRKRAAHRAKLKANQKARMEKLERQREELKNWKYKPRKE